MRVATTEVFTFGELNDKAQRTVLDRFRDNDQFHSTEDYQASLKAFCAKVGVQENLVEWEVSPCSPTFARYRHAADGWRFGTELWEDPCIPTDGNCPLTGHCADEGLIDGIRAASPGDTFTDVFQACLDGWIKEFKAEYDYWLSDESIQEDMEANDCEFTASGTPW